MRSLLCVSFVLLFSTTVAAQFSKNPPVRSAAKPTDATERKTADKGHTDRAAKAADQASAETDLANALLAIMDTDGDGVVTKIEMAKALAAIRKVPKDSKGNIAFEKPAGDGTALAGNDQAQGGAGATGPKGRRGNETIGRLMQYDRNRDGKLTPDELPPQAVAMLRDADLNGDGAIDARELAALSARMGEQMRALSAGAGPNGAGVPGDGGGRKPPRNDKKNENN